MDFLNQLNSEFQIQTLLAEAKVILNSKESDLNEEKENLARIIERVDFLLGKYDDIYDRFTDIFTAMGQFDFSKRLPFYESGDHFINFIVSGINILNEEFQSSAVHKKNLHNFFEAFALKDTIVLVTDPDGSIYIANAGKTELAGFNDVSLSGQNIHVVFSDFSHIENSIKSGDAVRSIETTLKWKDMLIPVRVGVYVGNTMGKIESVIYIIRFK